MRRLISGLLILVILCLSACQIDNTVLNDVTITSDKESQIIIIDSAVKSIRIVDGGNGFSASIIDEEFCKSVTELLKDIQFQRFIEAPEIPTGSNYNFTIETASQTIAFNSHKPVQIDGSYWYFVSAEDQKALMALMIKAYPEYTNNPEIAFERRTPSEYPAALAQSNGDVIIHSSGAVVNEEKLMNFINSINGGAEIFLKIVIYEDEEVVSMYWLKYVDSKLTIKSEILKKNSENDTNNIKVYHQLGQLGLLKTQDADTTQFEIVNRKDGDTYVILVLQSRDPKSHEDSADIQQDDLSASMTPEEVILGVHKDTHTKLLKTEEMLNEFYRIAADNKDQVMVDRAFSDMLSKRSNLVDGNQSISLGDMNSWTSYCSDVTHFKQMIDYLNEVVLKNPEDYIDRVLYPIIQWMDEEYLMIYGVEGVFFAVTDLERLTQDASSCISDSYVSYGQLMTDGLNIGSEGGKMIDNHQWIDQMIEVEKHLWKYPFFDKNEDLVWLYDIYWHHLLVGNYHTLEDHKVSYKYCLENYEDSKTAVIYKQYDNTLIDASSSASADFTDWGLGRAINKLVDSRSEDFSVHFGESKLLLDEAYENREILNLLGEPDNYSYQPVEPKNILIDGYSIYYYGGIEVHCFHFLNNESLPSPINFIITEKGFITGRGIQVGDTENMVLKLYPGMLYDEDQNMVFYSNYDGLMSIRFKLNDGVVTEIQIDKSFP